MRPRSFWFGVALALLRGDLPERTARDAAAQPSVPRGRAVAADRSAGCGKSARLTPGQPTLQQIQLPSGGLSREYFVTLPVGYSPSRPYPLVIGLHGWGLSGDTLLMYDGASAEARRGHVISVHPNGAKDGPAGYRGWNAVGSSMASGACNATCDASVVAAGDYQCGDSCGGECSRCSWTNCVDDVGFVETILDRVEGDLCVDRTKVRAHGESNGGMMIWELLQSRAAARFSTLISVIASPGLGTQLPPTAPVRFLGMWASRDRVMPAATLGMRGKVLSSDGFYYETAANATARAAVAWGCAASAPWPTEAKGVKCMHFPRCTPPAELVQCTFEGIHDWPQNHQVRRLIYQFYEGTSPFEPRLLRGSDAAKPA